MEQQLGSLGMQPVVVYVFRNCRGFAAGSYAMPIDIQTAITAEISGFIKGIEVAEIKGELSNHNPSKFLVNRVLMYIVPDNVTYVL